MGDENGVLVTVAERGPSASSELVWPLGAANRVDTQAASAAPAVVAVADLRAANAAAVLAVVRAASQPATMAALVEGTRLSRPTVEAIVEDLKESGLIDDAPGAEPPVPRRGRPARRFGFRADARYVVGLSVRSRSLAVCVADLAGTVVHQARRSVRRDVSGATRAAHLVSLARAALAAAAVDDDRVVAATVGTPGWVQDNARVRYVDNLKDWGSVDIVDILGRALGCSVAIENDANLAALGEHWAGVASSASDLVFVLLGERVGAGIIAGDRLLRGHHGAAGEIGFMVFPDGSPLAAGAVAGSGPVRPGLNPASIYSDAKIIRAAARGEREAVASLERVGTRLAEALAPVLLALDPTMVVLGANLFARGHSDEAYRHVLDAAARRSASLLVDPPKWRISSLGGDAVLVGATRFCLAAVDEVLLTRPTSLARPKS